MKTIKRYELRAKKVQVEEGGPAVYGMPLPVSSAVAKAAAAIIGEECQEVLIVFHLDAKNKILGYHEAARGSITECAVHMREVFRTAIVNGAVSIIVSHNHPSGDPTPSAADLEITKRMRKVGELVGISVLDHVVVGSDGTYSFFDAGLIK